MTLSRRHFVSAAAGALGYGKQTYGKDTFDPVAPWKTGVVKRPVSDIPNRHTIHTYYNVPPESPDGRYVLYFTSVTPEGHAGEIRMQERATGKETVLARNLDCEDAHRAACQQWLSGGRRVLFHDMRKGQVVAAVVDTQTLKERVLAKGRMVSRGRPDGDWSPIYGVPFQPGPYTDVELLNVATGEIRTLVTAADVRKAFPGQIQKLYGDRQISTPSGTLSPDGKLIFFKLSAVADDYKPLPPGHLKWPRKNESDRDGLVCFDIEHSRPLFFRRSWGHSDWRPNSRMFLNIPNVMIDAFTGKETPIPGLPKFPGQHASISPDGKLFVTDTQIEPFGGAKGEWGVAVCDIHGGSWTMLAKFQGGPGGHHLAEKSPAPGVQRGRKADLLQREQR